MFCFSTYSTLVGMFYDFDLRNPLRVSFLKKVLSRPVIGPSMNFHFADHPGSTIITGRKSPLRHDQLGAPVLGPAFFGFVGGNGFFLSVAVDVDARVGDSALDHDLLHDHSPVER